MAKLTRIFQRLFASTAPSTEVGEFGSFAAGSPVTTQDPALIQSLSNWLDGWVSAVVGPNAPAIEDMNGVCLVFARQLAYILQAGIAEYDATTVYYKESVVNYSGNIYVSLTDTNTGNTPPSISNWKLIGSGVLTKTANYTALGTDDQILADATSAGFNVTLPAALGLKGKKLTISKIDTTSNSITILRSGSDLILGEIFQTYITPYTSITWVSDGVSNWYAI